MRLIRLAPPAAALLLSACGAGPPGPPSGQSGIAVVQAPHGVADTAFLEGVAHGFYAGQADLYDMLVLWGALELSPSTSYYFPVKNDVPGLGDDPQGSTLFDHGERFESARLQGIVWMGPGWLDAPAGSGPRSALGILAQETAHRWGADVSFQDPAGKTSTDLTGRPYHWSFFLDTGASPLGGNAWVALGGNLFLAWPVAEVRFSALDLYLMGLVESDEVGPLKLLVNLRTPGGSADTRFRPDSSRVTEPVIVHADVQEVILEQIVAVHGLREPDMGFNASQIRQAWVYVGPASQAPAKHVLQRLERLRTRWPDEFARMTGGRSVMDCDLR